MRMINVVGGSAEDRPPKTPRTDSSTIVHSTALQSTSEGANQGDPLMSSEYRGMFRSLYGTGFLRDKHIGTVRASKKPAVRA